MSTTATTPAREAEDLTRLSVNELRQRLASNLERMTNQRDAFRAETDPDKRAAVYRDFHATERERERLHIEFTERRDRDAEALRALGLSADGNRTDGNRPGQHDFIPDLAGLAGRSGAAQPQGMTFRDVSTGREHRALLASESVYEAELRDQGRGQQRDSINVGNCLRALVTGQMEILNDAERRGMLSSIDSGGGFMLNPALSASFIDLARSASVCMKAGAQTVRITSAELNLARLDTDPQAHWRAEGVAVTGTDATFGRITLKPKTLAAIIPVPIELMEDAQNIANVLESALRAAMGLKLDQAALIGTGAGEEPKGVKNHSGVNSSTVGGKPANFDKYSEAVGKILSANFPDDASLLAWINHPRDEGTLDTLKDLQNQPLNPPKWVADLRRFRTTSLPINGGVGSNESISIVGDFRQLVLGMRTTGVAIRVLDSGQVTDADGVTHNAASQLKRLIVAYLRADVALLRPSWFTVIDQIQP